MRVPLFQTKDAYLAQPAVAAFCEFLAETISGIRSVRPPVHLLEDAGNEEVLPHTLEDAFAGYQWRGEGFEENAQRLNQMQVKIRSSVAEANAELCLEAVSECLRWGLGNSAPYKRNMLWAEQNNAALPELLAMGTGALEGDVLEIECFRDAVRMNSGYTKVFSLLSDGSIMYDSRVAAALGLMVAIFWQQGAVFEDSDFALLAFPRAPHRTPRNRNASFWDVRMIGRNPAEFSRVCKCFPSTNNDSRKHARANIVANWVLRDALNRSLGHGGSGALWCGTNDGLRRVEAALFMIGQEVPRFSSAN